MESMSLARGMMESPHSPLKTATAVRLRSSEEVKPKHDTWQDSKAAYESNHSIIYLKSLSPNTGEKYSCLTETSKRHLFVGLGARQPYMPTKSTASSSPNHNTAHRPSCLKSWQTPPGSPRDQKKIRVQKPEVESMKRSCFKEEKSRWRMFMFHVPFWFYVFSTNRQGLIVDRRHANQPVDVENFQNIPSCIGFQNISKVVQNRLSLKSH